MIRRIKAYCPVLLRFLGIVLLTAITYLWVAVSYAPMVEAGMPVSEIMAAAGLFYACVWWLIVVAI